MPAYDYDSKEAISMETESESEIQSYMEQVRYNDKKRAKMSLDGCQVWSKSGQVRDPGLDCDIFVV